MTEKHRKYTRLPLGTKFKYIDGFGTEWVILSQCGDGGCGTVAKWSGVDGPIAAQAICSAAGTNEDCRKLMVIVVDGQ